VSIPDLSQIGLHARRGAQCHGGIADCGRRISTGSQTAGDTPVQIAHYLRDHADPGLDGTSVGGCSFMIHVRHAAGGGSRRELAKTHSDHAWRKAGGHGSAILDARFPPQSLNGQFEQALRSNGAAEHVPQFPCCGNMKT